MNREASRGRVLIVDDDDAMATMTQSLLRARGFDVATRTRPEEVLQLLEREDFDAVVTDIHMPGLGGVDLCRRVLASFPSIFVVLVTAYGSLDSAIAAIRAGAHDYIPKPFEADQLAVALERGIQIARLDAGVQRLRQEVADPQSFGHILGASPKMMELYALLAKVADSDAAVLVTGESGTGKELIARALHDRGPRAKGPFVAVNCAAMPEALLESELFGHAKGAFTDARTAKAGLFVAAGGGTIFLDEVGEMPLGLQPKLLRALQERVVRPVGSTHEVPFDARVVAATNRDLDVMVQERTFREDLYFRLDVIQVALPPLRARGDDVLLLAQSFLERIANRTGKQVAGFTPAAAERLLAYPWPGNVRELQNCLERAVALASHDQIAISDLPEKVRAYESSFVAAAGNEPTELVSLAEVERRHVLRVLEGLAGNKSAASRVLGIERKTLYRMMDRWGAAGGAPNRLGFPRALGRGA